MVNFIDADLEFIEILNAFPIVKEKLIELKFNLDDVCDGISIKDYFKRKNFSTDEFLILMRKLNFEIKKHLKTSTSTLISPDIISDSSKNDILASMESQNCYEAEEEEE